MADLFGLAVAAQRDRGGDPLGVVGDGDSLLARPDLVQLHLSIRQDVPRHDRVDEDPVFRELVRHRFGERREPGAQRARHRQELDRLLRGERGQVHDPPPAPLAHFGQDHPAEANDVEERSFDPLAPLRFRQVQESRGRRTPAVRDQDVDRAEPGHRRGVPGGQVLFFRHVARDAQHFRDRRRGRHLFPRRLQLLSGPRADRHPAALAEERRRDRSPDSLARCRDHRDAPGDSEIHEARIIAEGGSALREHSAHEARATVIVPHEDEAARAAGARPGAASYFTRVNVSEPTGGVLPFITKWGVDAFEVFFFGFVSLSGALYVVPSSPPESIGQSWTVLV